MTQRLEVQRELLAVVQQCASAPPLQRPTFGAIGRRLRSIQKQAARLGLAAVTPRSAAPSLASYTPRTCITEAAFTPRPDLMSP